jgi:hypothetical protein
LKRIKKERTVRTLEKLMDVYVFNLPDIWDLFIKKHLENAHSHTYSCGTPEFRFLRFLRFMELAMRKQLQVTPVVRRAANQIKSMVRQGMPVDQATDRYWCRYPWLKMYEIARARNLVLYGTIHPPRPPLPRRRPGIARRRMMVRRPRATIIPFSAKRARRRAC